MDGNHEMIKNDYENQKRARFPLIFSSSKLFVLKVMRRLQTIFQVLELYPACETICVFYLYLL